MSQSQHPPLLPSPHNQNKHLLQFTQVLRFFNVILAFAVIAFSVFCYVSFKIQQNISILDDPSMTVLPAYIMLCQLVILGVQFNFKFIVKNFRFMFNYFGRGFFNVYVGILCLAMIRSSSEKIYKVIIWIVGILLIVFGLFYVAIALCCCAGPQENKYARASERQERVDDAVGTQQKDIKHQEQ